jgi:hypothetical protein
LHKGEAIWLWDLKIQQHLDQPLRQANPMSYISLPAWNTLAFNPDGNQLASVRFGHDVLLWDVSLASWQAGACRRAKRNLTPDEWHRFIGPHSPYRATCPNLPVGKEGSKK